MNLVLPGTPVRLPRLGYGCASLMARASRTESVRWLETAFDAGITHFDVARSYGYGEAERVVGDLLARRRDQVTVATKLGITPPAHQGAMRLAKAIARPIAAASPGLRRRFRAGAARTVATGRFSTEDAARSLDTSLRELRTDTIDLLLLHDCTLQDLHDDLLAYLQTRTQAGDVLAFGVATSREAATDIARARPEFAAVVQVPDSVLDPPLGDLGPRITHSALAAAQPRLRQHLADPVNAEEWSAAVGADLRDGEILARLLLTAALERNAAGTVLVSSRREGHIRANAQVVREPPLREQVVVFTRLAAGLTGGAPLSAADADV